MGSLNNKFASEGASSPSRRSPGNLALNNGIFDTTTRVLSLAVGYGSAAGFSDLTGPATAMHIHGKAGPGTNAVVLIHLISLHLPAADPAKGGVIFGGVPSPKPRRPIFSPD